MGRGVWAKLRRTVVGPSPQDVWLARTRSRNRGWHNRCCGPRVMPTRSFWRAVLAPQCIALIFASAGCSGGADAGGSTSDAGAKADAARGSGPSALHVLFIGDSYTYVNDLPGMLTDIAASAGVPPTITTDEVVQGGATLDVQWSNEAAQAKIKEGSWTHVVVQGQSLEPLTAVTLGGTTFFTYAQQFGDLIVQSGAKPTFFVTWARAAGDSLYAPLPSGIFAYPVQMQDELDIAYAEVARQWPQSILACVGEAFQRSIAEYPEVVLQQSDLSHPTVAGTYLAASTFYVALTGHAVPAQSAVPAGVSAEDAAKVRSVALVGSNCANVELKGALSTSFPAGADGGSLFDFGTAGSPITTELELMNTGGMTVGIRDGMTLAPPFAWTAGAYPGGSGAGFCGSSLAPGASCDISVTYTGKSSATGMLTLGLTGSYYSTARCSLRATTTRRALLTVSDSPGPFACTDATCPPNQVSASLMSSSVTPLTLYVLNLGALPATSLGPGTPLSPPFAWAGGVFPGGTGSVLAGNPPTSVPYCSSALGVGEQCAVTVSFSPTAVGMYAAAVNLAYSDAMGPVSPNANRNIEGKCTNTPPLPP
jgi:hypothetical protein